MMIRLLVPILILIILNVCYGIDTKVPHWENLECEVTNSKAHH